MTLSRTKKLLILTFFGIFLFFLARLSIFILYNDLYKDFSFSDILLSFIRGLRFDGAIFFTFSAVFFAFLLFPVKNKLYHKIVLWLMFPLYLFFIFFLSSDVLYFGYVNRHLTNEPFLLGQDTTFIFDMAKVYILPLIIAIIFIVILSFLWNKFVNINMEFEKSYKHYGIVFVLWVGVIFLIIRGTVSDKPLSTIDAYVSGNSDLGNLTLNGLFSTFKYYSHQSNATASDYNVFPDKEAENILNLYTNKPCQYPIINKEVKPNIVFILLESWSAYYTDSFSNNNLSLTPNFDNIAKNSIKFNKHYAPDKRSISAIQSVLTGIPPINGLPSLGFGLETMAKGNLGKILHDNNYDTIFIQSSKRRSFYMDSIAKSLGFKEYYGMEDTKTILDYPNKTASKFGWDYETYLLLLDKIKDKGKNKPFMAFIFTGTTHTPYAKLPQEFIKFPYEEDGENGFKNTLIYADWSLGEFFNKAQKEEWFNNTIFMISADHNLGRFEKTSFPEDYRVPLLIYSPLIKDKYTVENASSHIDLPPTIISLANIDVATDYLGENIFCKDEKSFAVISIGHISGIVNKSSSLLNAKDKVLDFYPKDLKLEEQLNMQKALLSYYQVEFNKIFNKNSK